MDPTVLDFAFGKYHDRIAELEKCWRDLIDALEAFSAEQLVESGSCGTWSVRDVMSHIAGWDLIAISTIEGILSGEHHETMESTQQINDRSIVEAGNRTLIEVRLHMWQIHERLISSLHDQSAKPYDALERIEAAVCGPTAAHYCEHEAQLRRVTECFD